MREIEFRIEDHKGKWHYGYPVFFDDGSFDFFVNEKLNELLPYEECSVECAFNNTLGQYTGLCDKNGTKIFEGDIIKWITSLNDNIVGKIIFKDCAFVVSFKDYLGDICGMKDIEVIGNIYDNPELLEGK